MSATNLALTKQRIADFLARSALRVPALEKFVVRGCKHPSLRRLGVGAIAHGYSRILRRRELRIAELERYRFWVNVAEPLGIEPFFFGHSGAVWLAPALVRSGDVCVDAGANTGHYTFLMASIVGKSGHVYAVEANPEMVELLRRSIALNEYGAFVEVLPRAIWNVAGETLKFYLSQESTNSGTSSLVNHGYYLSPEHAISVTTTTLDSFARERSLEHLRLVKIDVERVEDQVILGAEGLLRDHQIDYLIVELVRGTQAEQTLERHGYAAYFLDPAKRKLRPLATIAEGTFCDALFVSPRQQAAFMREFSYSIEMAAG